MPRSTTKIVLNVGCQPYRQQVPTDTGAGALAASSSTRQRPSTARSMAGWLSRRAGLTDATNLAVACRVLGTAKSTPQPRITSRQALHTGLAVRQRRIRACFAATWSRCWKPTAGRLAADADRPTPACLVALGRTMLTSIRSAVGSSGGRANCAVGSCTSARARPGHRALRSTTITCAAALVDHAVSVFGVCCAQPATRHSVKSSG